VRDGRDLVLRAAAVVERLGVDPWLDEIFDFRATRLRELLG
jgi:hypothetical protein